MYKSNLEWKQKTFGTQEEFFEKYPFMKCRSAWNGEYIEPYDEYDYGWLELIPQGWALAFGKQLLDEIREALIEVDDLYNYRIVQIKEKYAELRIYDNGKKENCRVWDIIEKYENISYKTCIKCGASANYYTEGWIIPLCENCKNNDDKHYYDIDEEIDYNLFTSSADEVLYNPEFVKNIKEKNE